MGRLVRSAARAQATTRRATEGACAGAPGDTWRSVHHSSERSPADKGRQCIYPRAVAARGLAVYLGNLRGACVAYVRVLWMCVWCCDTLSTHWATQRKHVILYPPRPPSAFSTASRAAFSIHTELLYGLRLYSRVVGCEIRKIEVYCIDFSRPSPESKSGGGIH